MRKLLTAIFSISLVLLLLSCDRNGPVDNPSDIGTSTSTTASTSVLTSITTPTSVLTSTPKDDYFTPSSMSIGSKAVDLSELFTSEKSPNRVSEELSKKGINHRLNDAIDDIFILLKTDEGDISATFDYDLDKKLTSIRIHDGCKYKTSKGISIGDTLGDAIKAYGKDYIETTDDYGNSELALQFGNIKFSTERNIYMGDDYEQSEIVNITYYVDTD